MLTGVQNLSPCNREEADTRIMYYCTLEDKLTAVIASDPNTLILVVLVFTSRLHDHARFLQTKKNQFVNVSKIHDYIGNRVAITLPAMIVLTGCDAVSYFYVSPGRLYLSLEARSLSCCASVRFRTAYLSLGDVRRKAEKSFPDICLWYVCSNVFSNLLSLTVQKQPPEVICKKRCS